MCDPTTILAAVQVGSSLLGSDAASTAGQQQADAANRASDTQLQMFNTVNAQGAPYRQIGQTALSAISAGMGFGAPPGAKGIPLSTSGGTANAGGYQLPSFEDILAYNKGSQADAQRQWSQIQSGAMGSPEDIYKQYAAAGFPLKSALPGGGAQTQQQQAPSVPLAQVGNTVTAPAGSGATVGTGGYQLPSFEDILSYNSGNQADAQHQWQQIQSGAMGSPEDIYKQYAAAGFPLKSAIVQGVQGETQAPGSSSNAATVPLSEVGAASTVEPNNTPVPFGDFTHTFTTADLKNNLAPNYDFVLEQGLNAAKNAGNMQTGLVSGNTARSVVDYAQNMAGNAYQNSFNNYNANQTNIFNRLSTIAGYGTTTNQTTANAGTSLAGNAGNSQIAAGAGQAAGTVGAANALTGGATNAASWYSLPQIMNMGGSGGSSTAGLPSSWISNG